jgi:ribosomal protein L30/L7E
MPCLCTLALLHLPAVLDRPLRELSVSGRRNLRSSYACRRVGAGAASSLLPPTPLRSLRTLTACPPSFPTPLRKPSSTSPLARTSPAQASDSTSLSAMRPSSSLAAMGLRHPQHPKPPPLAPRKAPPKAHYPFYHPLRSQYPHPAVQEIPASVRRATPHAEKPTHYRITLRRSGLRLPEKIGRTLRVLGLTRKDRTVFHPFTPNTAGAILGVKELVEVRLVDWKQMAAEMKRGKGGNQGWEQVRPTTGAAADVKPKDPLAF